jgi:hypothetical protein
MEKIFCDGNTPPRHRTYFEPWVVGKILRVTANTIYEYYGIAWRRTDATYRRQYIQHIALSARHTSLYEVSSEEKRYVI